MSEFGKLKALAFDYFGTVGDKQGLSTVIDDLIPGNRGAELARLWFQTCQRYCFQNGMMGRYTPWNELTVSALEFATADLGVAMSGDVKSQLLEADGQVPVYPEAPAALARLAGKYALYVLSMGSAAMIERSQRQAAIEVHFTAIITTEEDRVYKPGRAAYDVGVREIGMTADEIGFVSGNSFDVIGARNFGFPTFWVRRYDQPLDGLGLAPDLITHDLGELADALGV